MTNNETILRWLISSENGWGGIKEIVEYPFDLDKTGKNLDQIASWARNNAPDTYVIVRDSVAVNHVFIYSWCTFSHMLTKWAFDEDPWHWTPLSAEIESRGLEAGFVEALGKVLFLSMPVALGEMLGWAWGLLKGIYPSQFAAALAKAIEEEKSEQ